MKKLLNLQKFKVKSPAVELVQMYASRDAHTWIKTLASENSVKMTHVIEELINYAETDRAAFKRIRKALGDLVLETASFPVTPDLRTEVNQLINELGEL